MLAATGPSSPDPVIASPLLRIERLPVAGGGELRTYFRRLPDHHANGLEIPLVSILEDTMGDGDPANDRARYVYAFGFARPTLWQRFSAAVPFLYRRAGGDRRRHPMPAPLIDMAAPSNGTIPKIAGAALQSSYLDPLGIPYRASSRAYRGRTSEYRDMNVYRALEVLRSAPPEAGGFGEEDLARIQGRLVLSTRILGGLVSESAAPSAWIKRRNASAMNLGHNWELLRQRADQNGLEFQPLRIGSEDTNFALLWVRADEPKHAFDSRFLGIGDPFSDARIRDWQGYSETWYFDNYGSREESGEAGAHPVRMIPLGLYALDHPKAPLLMIDFRRPGKLKRREMALRFSDDVATGVLGFTGWGNLPYMATKQVVFLVRGRWGAPVSREARVNAYMQLRQGLLMDRGLPEPLHHELVRNIDRLGWNPFEEGIGREVKIAESQYRALAGETNGSLARKLAEGREREIRNELHSGSARAGLRAATIATFGIYRHHDELTPERLAEVNRIRRDSYQERLQPVLAVLPPRPTVVTSAGAAQ